MQDWIRSIIKIAVVVMGLVAIYIGLSQSISNINQSIQKEREATVGAAITSSFISDHPFSDPVAIVTRGSQVFYNMAIVRNAGHPCYVSTSWRWILHLPTGNSVMWVANDGQFYSGDRDENLAQAVKVPVDLIPGDYTLSRLAVFKCGDVQDYAKIVRDTTLRVK